MHHNLYGTMVCLVPVHNVILPSGWKKITTTKKKQKKTQQGMRLKTLDKHVLLFLGGRAMVWTGYSNALQVIFALHILM